MAIRQAVASAEQTIWGKFWANNENKLGVFCQNNLGAIADKKLAGASGKNAMTNG